MSGRRVRRLEISILLLFRNKMEKKMKLTVITVLALPVFTAISAQAVASEHHHMRTSDRSAVFAQWRNSNAYAEPVVQPYRPNYDEGAMTSGIAGH